MNILITGGAGFIGSHLADKFLKEDHNVKIIDNLETGNVNNIPKGAEFVKGDIRNLDFLIGEFKDIDCINHHAALVSVSESDKKQKEYYETNVVGTQNVLKAAQRNKIKKVIFASSCAVYGNSKKTSKETDPLGYTSNYTLTKILGEKECQSFYDYFDMVILRYFNIFGPKQNINSGYAAVIPLFINSFIEGKKSIIYGDGKQTRDFIYIENIVEANLRAVERDVGGQIINIASGQSIDIKSLADKIGVEYTFAPERKGDIKYSSASINLSKKILGNYNTYSFDEGLNKTIRWYENAPAEI